MRTTFYMLLGVMCVAALTSPHPAHAPLRPYTFIDLWEQEFRRSTNIEDVRALETTPRHAPRKKRSYRRR